MGKRRSVSKYVHAHKHNPNARESEERKLQSLKKIEIKRLNSLLSKQRVLVESYISPEDIQNNKNARELDPKYHLKGAASAAQQHYLPPNYRDLIEPKNLLMEYKGRTWDHEECRKLLRCMNDLGVAMHNIASGRTKDAMTIFKEMLQLDSKDHLLARHKLLRCYLDEGLAAQARELIDRYTAPITSTNTSINTSKKMKNSKTSLNSSSSSVLVDNSSCFAYSRALIEFISLSLGEDTSQAVRDEALAAAVQQNPLTLWVIAFPDETASAVDHLQLLDPLSNPFTLSEGSVEEALYFHCVDGPLWKDTEGAVQWVRKFIKQRHLTVPVVSVEDDAVGMSVANTETGRIAGSVEDMSAEEMHKMFVGMFTTAMEMIADLPNDEEDGDDDEEVKVNDDDEEEDGDCKGRKKNHKNKNSRGISNKRRKLEHQESSDDNESDDADGVE